MKKNQRIILIYSLIITLVSCNVIQVYADNDVDNPFYNEAFALKELGLFKGTDQGFELDMNASRSQGAVMLVRFMGDEDLALKAYEDKMISHPFTDVPTWADPHVAYLYSLGLTKGISSTLYGSNDRLTGEQYMTMLLRLLGYDDAVGEFTWNQSYTFMEDVFNPPSDDVKSIMKYEKIGLTRGAMVKLSYMALAFEYKNYTLTVAKRLRYKEVISEKLYQTYMTGDLAAFDPDSSLDVDGSGGPDFYDLDEVKAIWVSYIDLKPILYQKSKEDFSNSIDDYFSEISDLGLNTVYLQVRPFEDAIYQSDIFPWSNIITGTEGVDPGFDPLLICIDKAHQHRLRIEAWINPYRVRTNVKVTPLSDASVINTRLRGDESAVFTLGNLVTLNPGNEEVKQLVIDGVEELISNYDVDGVQFDDYFYPSSDLSLDQEQYQVYVDQQTSKGLTYLSHEGYRQSQVADLIASCYKRIKSMDKNMVFGLSPQGSFANNRELVYLDPQDLVDMKSVDYIAPQIYYGFKNEYLPFDTNLDQWGTLVKGTDISLIIGLASYKIGLEDKWAGSGSHEWIDTNSLMKQMIVYSRPSLNYKGFSFFRFASLFTPSIGVEKAVKEELEGIANIIDK